MTPSAVPPFTVDGVRFLCRVNRSNCYVWVSDCGRFSAFRLGRQFSAAIDGQELKSKPIDLCDAMRIAVQAGRKAACLD